MICGSTADSVAWVGGLTGESFSASVATQLYPIAVRNFTTLVWTDHLIVPAVNDDASVRFYSDSPRIAIVSASPGTGGAIQERYDLREDRLLGLAREPASDPLVADHKLWFGALEGALEHEVVARDLAILGGDPATVTSTSSSLTAEGAISLGSSDVDRVPALTTDADTAALLTATLRAGNRVVAAKAALTRGKATWWEVAADADVRAVLDGHLNGSEGALPRGGLNSGLGAKPLPPTDGGKVWDLSNPSKAPGGRAGARGSTTGPRRGRRPGNEYLMVLQVSQIVVVALTVTYVVLYTRTQAQAADELSAWSAAEQAKQDRAMRAARGGR